MKETVLLCCRNKATKVLVSILTDRSRINHGSFCQTECSRDCKNKYNQKREESVNHTFNFLFERLYVVYTKIR